MNDIMAALITVEDPEGIEPVADAYCTLTEVHANFKTQSLIVVFECWRSRDAFVHKRQPFTAVTVRFERDNGGKAYFERFGIDGCRGDLGAGILDFCIQNADVMKNARKLSDNISDKKYSVGEDVKQEGKL